MRLDQIARLEALNEKLLDVFLVVADPDNMSGAGKKPADLTKEERGNLAWDVKTANATGLLTSRGFELTARAKWAQEGMVEEQVPGGELGSVLDPDAEIRRFEAAALKALEKAGARRAA